MLEIELLQIALGGRQELSHTPSAEEWDRIYGFANEQAITGIMFRGVELLPKHQRPAISLLMNWFAQTETIKRQNTLANADCRKITEIFRKEGFRTSIMKGQGNAIFYRTNAKEASKEGPSQDLSMLRTSGDIDIWVDGGLEKVNDFVQKLSPTKEINELEIQLRGVCRTPVEVHYRPFIMRNPWTNRRLQKFFSEEADNCFLNDSGFTTLRFNLIHQLAHIRLHLFTEGIGMKQLVDYYFLLLHSTEDKADVMQTVDNLGMRNFTRAMMWVMHEVMLLPREYLLCEEDPEGGRLLINDILKHGNFGRSNTEQRELKSSRIYGLWALLVRNLKYWRFDRWDWICGPLWRIYHRIWRKRKGYK